MWRLWMAAALLAGCAQVNAEGLSSAVDKFNRGLRWKYLEEAAVHVAAERRGEFLQRHLAAEESLHVESMEVRAVQLRPDAERPSAEVMVQVYAYLLPSTVLERIVLVQTWELRETGWQLVAWSPDLAPRKAASLAASR